MLKKATYKAVFSDGYEMTKQGYIAAYEAFTTAVLLTDIKLSKVVQFYGATEIDVSDKFLDGIKPIIQHQKDFLGVKDPQFIIYQKGDIFSEETN